MPSRLSTPRPPSRPSSIGGRRADDAVHRRGQQRQLEAVRAEGPGDVDVVGIARAPRRHDRDVVEPVGPPALLAASDLYFHSQLLLRSLKLGVRGRKKPLGKGPESRFLRALRPDSKALAMITAVNLGSGDARRDVELRDARPAKEPLDLAAVERPGAEMLGRLGPAGDPEGEAFARRSRPRSAPRRSRRGSIARSRPWRSARAGRSATS